MSSNKENKTVKNNDPNKISLALYEHIIEIWRVEEKCRREL